MNTENKIPKLELLPADVIYPSPMNPRKTFSEDALKELADNISSQGLLQPITVRPVELSEGMVSYQIVCGERRFRACKMVGMAVIPCIVREMTDEEAFDAMITENLQRRDVDPIEEAIAFKLLHDRGVAYEELASRFGKSVRYVQDRILLSELQEPIRKAVSEGRLTLRGGYLLARLKQDDQQAFYEEEMEGYDDADFTTSDIEDWLDRHFMNLWHAPFHDGETLQEKWNPDGSLIRRCDTCDCNTCNQGCLFADMKTEEPQCINETCYTRKMEVYYEWLLHQYESRFVLAGHPATAGSIALIGMDSGCYYSDETKEAIKKLTEKYTAAGYRVFKDKELPSRIWDKNAAEGELHDGTAIEVLELSDVAKGYTIKLSVRRIPGAEASRPADPAQPSNYPARLCERSASIKSTADKKVISYAKKNFDQQKYTSDTRSLQDWEHVILMAIVFDKLPWNYHDALIPGTNYTSPTYQQMEEFVNRSMKDASWKRKAIAAFITSSYKESFFEEAMKHISIEAEAFINTIRKDADKRITAIKDELHEMGYDEKANQI